MRLSFCSLRSRVMLIVLIAVIPAVGIMTYNSLAQRQDAARRAQDETLNLVRLIAQEQSSLITSARQLLLSLSLFPALRHLTELGELPADSRAHPPMMSSNRSHSLPRGNG